MTMRRLSSAQLGEALGLRPATVQQYAREGRIPCELTPGGHRRFDLDEVRAALLAEKGASASSTERAARTSVFGPSKRARAMAAARAVRTTDADVAAAAERRAAPQAGAVEAPRSTAAAAMCSAAVELLANAGRVYLSAAR